MADFIVAEVNQLQQPQPVLVHLVEVFDIAFQRVTTFQSRQHRYLIAVARFQHRSRRIRMDRIAELEGLAYARESICGQRIHLTGHRLVPALGHNGAIAIHILAVVRHVATDVCDDQVDRTATIDLDFLRRDRFDVLAMKAARVGVHIREDRKFMNGQDPRIRLRDGYLDWRCRAGAAKQQPGQKQRGSRMSHSDVRPYWSAHTLLNRAALRQQDGAQTRVRTWA